MGAAVAQVRELYEAYRPRGEEEGWLDRDRAHDRLVELARRRAADDVAMLEPLRIAEESGVHELLGLGSFQEYCSRLFGWGGRQTRERLRVARAMRELPATRARWAAGELTYSVVRELTRVATPAVEQDWLTWAREGGVRRTAREVQQVVARHARGSRPTDPPAPFEEQTVRVVLEMSGSEAARFAEVRAEATRRLGEAVSDEVLAKMLFDAFLHGGRAGAEQGSASAAGTAPNQVKLTVCERCGATERQAGAEGLVPVDPVIGEAARCDAQMLRSGQRAAQTVPPATRREVVRRDEGKCAVPGCRHAAFVEVHHVHRRADGGEHDSANLVSLCSVHHDAAHRGRLVIRADDGAFRFERADGRAYGTVGRGDRELRRCASLAQRFEVSADRSGSETVARKEGDARLRVVEAAAHVSHDPGGPPSVGPTVSATLRAGPAR